MPITRAEMWRMVAAGASGRDVAKAVDEVIHSVEETIAAKREKDRLRKRRERTTRGRMVTLETKSRGSHAEVTRTGNVVDIQGAHPRDVTATNGVYVSSFLDHRSKKEKYILKNDAAVISAAFERFWNSYPKRPEGNPKKPAALSFARAVRKGADPEAIIAAARVLAKNPPKETKFIPMATTWLNQERWEGSQHETNEEKLARWHRLQDQIRDTDNGPLGRSNDELS